MKFLGLLAATVLLAGLNACDMEPEAVEPEFSATITPTSIAYDKATARGLDYDMTFQTRVEILSVADRFEDIDIRFSCELGRAPYGFGISRNSPQSVLVSCAPAAVPEYLDGLSVLSAARPRSGIHEFLLLTQDSGQNEVLFFPSESDAVESSLEITSEGSADLTIYSYFVGGGGRTRGADFFDVVPFSAADISLIKVTILEVQ